MKTKFLVRLDDFHIFDLDESNQCYRSWCTRGVTYKDGTRPQALPNFTYKNLVENYGFLPIEESELEKYEKKHEEHMKFVIWRQRPDGHDGVKGGTLEEFKKLKENQQ